MTMKNLPIQHLNRQVALLREPSILDFPVQHAVKEAVGLKYKNVYLLAEDARERESLSQMAHKHLFEIRDTLPPETRISYEVCFGRANTTNFGITFPKCSTMLLFVTSYTAYTRDIINNKLPLGASYIVLSKAVEHIINNYAKEEYNASKYVLRTKWKSQQMRNATTEGFF